jgi:hypothetical protein
MGEGAPGERRRGERSSRDGQRQRSFEPGGVLEIGSRSRVTGASRRETLESHGTVQVHMAASCWFWSDVRPFVHHDPKSWTRLVPPAIALT